MNKPRLLDLFCGAGGCSVGYARAGFDCVGVDIAPQRSYPFPFIQSGAVQAMQALLRSGGLEDTAGRTWLLSDFHAIHASPPCQRFSQATKVHGKKRVQSHPDLVAPTRELLEATGLPWVIENVIGAPVEGCLLCGTMFGLRVFRHRLFETSFFCMIPSHPKHNGSTGAHRGYSTLRSGRNGYVCVAGHNFIREQGAAAMGIDWMRSRKELAQAIPPAYTEFIGKQLMDNIT